VGSQTTGNDKLKVPESKSGKGTFLLGGSDTSTACPSPGDNDPGRQTTRLDPQAVYDRLILGKPK
jgi:hypothetical protein